MSKLLKSLFLALVASLISLPLSAQLGFCFDFDENPPLPALWGEPTGMQPGDEVYEENGVSVSAELLHVSNDSSVFFVGLMAEAAEYPEFTLASGNLMGTSDLSMGFDFSNLAYPVVGLSVSVWEEVGPLNISVNGEEVWIVDSLADLPTVIAPGVTAQWYNTALEKEGILSLSGPISNLIIGGGGIGIDDLCVTQDPTGGVCSISNVQLQPYSCDGEGTYLLLVDFDVVNPLADSFSLSSDTEDFGTFAYSDLPITIGSLTGDGISSHTFSIHDLEDTDCQATAVLEPVDCSIACVTFESLSAGTQYGMQTGYLPGDTLLVENDIPITLSEFFYQNGSTGYGSLLADDGFLAGFDPMDGVYVFPSNLNMVLDLTHLPGQVTGIRFGYVDSGGELNLGLNEAAVVNVTSMENLPGQLSPDVSVTVVSDTSNILANGYVFLEGPIDSLLLGGQELAVDNICVFIQNYVAPCSIADLEAVQHPCDAQDSFYVDLDFSYENTGNFGFDVVGNGNFYGNFDYANLPITIGPLAGNGNTVFEFEVRDAEFQDCFTAVEFGLVSCGDQCIEMEGVDQGYYGSLSGYGVGDTIFMEDGVTITLDEFEYFNGDTFLGNVNISDNIFPDTLLLSGNSAFMGNVNMVFDFSSLPGEVISVSFAFVDGGGEENFAVNGGPIHVLHDFLELPLQNIPGFNVSVTDLTPANVFGPRGYVTLEGAIEQLTLGGQEMAIDYICFVQVEPTPCHITELVAEPGACNGDGQFFVDLDFQYEGVGLHGFSVAGNGNDYGTFSYDSLPVQIGPLAGDGLTIYEFIVTDVDSTDCQAAIGLDGPVDCSSNCEIWDVVAEAYPCNNDGAFLVDLDFNYQGTGNDGFSVQGNGTNYGTFSYNDLPITLGPLPGDGQTVYEFVVKDVVDPDCNNFTVLGPIDCAGGNCDIFALEYELIEVLPEGYKLLIDFNFENVSGTGFDVFYNGEFVVFLDPNDQPADFILPCNLVNSNVGELTVCDHGHPDCCETIVIELPPCTTDCQINDLIVEPYACEGGEFLVDLTFNYENVSGDGFFVVVNNEEYGPFSYDELYLTLGPFAGDGQTVYTFHVFDVAHPDCNAFFELEPIDCGGNNCALEIIELYPVEVGNASVLYLLEVAGQNTGGLGYDVFFNDEFIGFYEYGQQPVEIFLPCVEPGGNPVGVLTVCDNDNPDCCSSTEVELIPCFDCFFGELNIEILACNTDGFFNVLLDFEYFNTGNDGFKVFGNGQSYGIFNYDELPVELGPFEGNGVDVYELIVQDVQFPDLCTEEIVFGPVDCESTGDVWPGDANSDNIAHHFDLLNIGIAYGFNGPPRDQLSIDWQGWPASNWDEFFEENDLNYKHADCNGDGVVNTDDVGAIQENYNLTHGNVTPFVPIQGDEEDPPFFVDLPLAGDITLGEPFTAPVVLGEMSNPVEDIYGIAFTIQFDPDLIEPASVEVEIDQSWLGTQDVNKLSIVREFVEDGLVEVAITRIDQNNVSGFGPIASFIGIIDDVLGKQELTIEVIDVKAIMYNEMQIPLYRPVEVVEIVSGTTVTAWAEAIRLYPNPTSGWVFFDIPAGMQLSRMEVVDVNGSLLKQFEHPNRGISLEALMPGVYWLKLVVDGQPVYRKVVKF